MNALKGRVSSDLDNLVNRTDSPFTAAVNTFPLPQKYRMPHIDSYDGVKDPLDHLETFKTLMHLQGVADEIMCRAFPTSFTPLTAPVDQVLMQIKDKEALTYPRKFKGDPYRCSKDKYCRFHQDHGLDTADC